MNDVIEALERAAVTLECQQPNASNSEKDAAATIRQHIADLRAGNLVRREDVVGICNGYKRDYEAAYQDARERGDEGAMDRTAARLRAVQNVAHAIERGEHLRGGGLMTDERREAHEAVATAIAERFLCQPKEMPWEQRCDELATAAIEGLQLHFDYVRSRQGLLDS